MTTKEIKAEKVLRETPKKETFIVNSATNKKAMTAEEAELEKRRFYIIGSKCLSV